MNVTDRQTDTDGYRMTAEHRVAKYERPLLS